MTSNTNEVEKRWKVPVSVKIGIGLFGALCIIIAIAGMITQGHAQLPQSAKGCIANDQASGRTFIDVRCLYNWNTVQTICDNWPNGNATMPQALSCSPDEPDQNMTPTTSTPVHTSGHHSSGHHSSGHNHHNGGGCFGNVTCSSGNPNPITSNDGSYQGNISAS